MPRENGIFYKHTYHDPEDTGDKCIMGILLDIRYTPLKVFRQ